MIYKSIFLPQYKYANIIYIQIILSYNYNDFENNL